MRQQLIPNLSCAAPKSSFICAAYANPMQCTRARMSPTTGQPAQETGKEYAFVSFVHSGSEIWISRPHSKKWPTQQARTPIFAQTTCLAAHTNAHRLHCLFWQRPHQQIKQYSCDFFSELTFCLYKEYKINSCPRKKLFLKIQIKLILKTNVNMTRISKIIVFIGSH